MYLYKIRLIFQAKSEGWHAPYLDYKLNSSYAENGLLMFSSQTFISKTKYYGTARQSEWVHKCHTYGMFALCFIYLAEFVAHKTDKIDTSSLQKMMKMNNLIFKSGNIWRKAVLQLQRVQRVQLLFSTPQALQPSTLLYTLITTPPHIAPISLRRHVNDSANGTEVGGCGESAKLSLERLLAIKTAHITWG